MGHSEGLSIRPGGLVAQAFCPVHRHPVDDTQDVALREVQRLRAALDRIAYFRYDPNKISAGEIARDALMESSR